MKQQEQLEFITSTRAHKISNYPYYPIAHALPSENGITYLFKLNFTPEQQSLSILPFDPNNQQMMIVEIDLRSLPKKMIGALHVLQLKCKEFKHTIEFQSIDFMVGFRAGYLIRASAVKKKPAKVVEKYNVLYGEKEGLVSKLSGKIFSSEDFYRVWVDGPVRNFEKHESENQKYKFSYQIKNTLFFQRTLSEQADFEIQKQFKLIKWEELKEGSYKNQKSLLIKTKNFQTLITSSQMIIQSQQEICSYVYINSFSLAVANNSEGKVIFYDINNMKELKVFGFDIQVKKISLFNQFLVVMPYENSLYVVDTEKELSCRLTGHKSFITNAVITKNGNVVTGGCDHRISFQSIKAISKWEELKKENRMSIIDTSKNGLKFESMYHLGKFNNVRNNEYDYGFGNFLELGRSLYAYLTFDFQIKIFKINK